MPLPMPKQKSILIVCRNAPYGNSLAREAIETALACAVFDQRVALLFIDEGLFQFVKVQSGAAINRKDQAQLLSAAPLYDLNELYADLDSCTTHGIDIDDFCVDATLINRARVADLFHTFDQVLSF